MLVSATVISSISKQCLFKYKWLPFFGYVKFGCISGLYQTTLEPSSNSVVIFFIVKNETLTCLFWRLKFLNLPLEV